MSDVVAIPGGIYRLGSDDHYPEERPVREAEVAAFGIDRTLVTNAAFAAFIEATNYVTLAERADPRGSAVFAMSAGPVDLTNPSLWWRFEPNTSWRAPAGQASSWRDLEDHPVTHVALEDARAFAAWRGVRLPTETEWEVAARGGLAGVAYAWGDEFAPNGHAMANVWSGMFPWYSDRKGGLGTTSVGAYPANGYGLHDMIGNVWEWTETLLSAPKPCGCTPDEAAEQMFVLKGGSYLCAGEYCARYRPAARIGLTPTSTTGHVGFRCAVDL